VVGLALSDYLADRQGLVRPYQPKRRPSDLDQDQENQELDEDDEGEDDEPEEEALEEEGAPARDREPGRGDEGTGRPYGSAPSR
jgi:hypothetical protein